MSIYDYALAGNDTFGNYSPNQLYSGDMDIVTGPGSIGAGQVLDKYTVLGRVTTGGALVPHAPAASDGSQNAVAILMTAINTTAAQATTPLGVVLPVGSGNVATLTECYWGGCFNPDMLVWNAATSTTLLRIAAFDRSNIRIQKPL